MREEGERKKKIVRDSERGGRKNKIIERGKKEAKAQMREKKQRERKKETHSFHLLLPGVFLRVV